jgi:hypothetical protein
VPDRPVTGDELLSALRRLGEILYRRGVTADLYVFGGAAMVLAYQARVATRDIDAVFVPDTEVLDAAREVARERGWPRTWLNDQASAYVSALPDQDRRLVLEAPGIRCMAASPERLLAMKVLAARRAQDAGDIRFLANLLGLTGVEQVLAIVAGVFPDLEVNERARLLVEDVLAEGR